MQQAPLPPGGAWNAAPAAPPLRRVKSLSEADSLDASLECAGLEPGADGELSPSSAGVFRPPLRRTASLGSPSSSDMDLLSPAPAHAHAAAAQSVYSYPRGGANGSAELDVSGSHAALSGSMLETSDVAGGALEESTVSALPVFLNVRATAATAATAATTATTTAASASSPRPAGEGGPAARPRGFLPGGGAGAVPVSRLHRVPRAYRAVAAAAAARARGDHLAARAASPLRFEEGGDAGAPVAADEQERLRNVDRLRRRVKLRSLGGSARRERERASAASPRRGSSSGGAAGGGAGDVVEEPPVLTPEQQAKLLDRGIRSFNLNPVSGLRFLLEKRVIAQRRGDDAGNARNVAAFLKDTPGLGRVQIGVVLGEEASAPVLQHYVSLFSFADCANDVAGVEQALRRFVTSFKPPGEAQKIDRILAAFADKFAADHPVPEARAVPEAAPAQTQPPAGGEPKAAPLQRGSRSPQRTSPRTPPSAPLQTPLLPPPPLPLPPPAPSPVAAAAAASADAAGEEAPTMGSRTGSFMGVTPAAALGATAGATAGAVSAALSPLSPLFRLSPSASALFASATGAAPSPAPGGGSEAGTPPFGLPAATPPPPPSAPPPPPPPPRALPSDLVHRVAFAVLVLNVDLHHPSNWRRRMTRPEFLAVATDMMKGVEDSVAPSRDSWERLYDSVHSDEIKHVADRADVSGNLFSNPDMAGFLDVRVHSARDVVPGLSPWRRRWCMVSANNLYFFDSPTDVDFTSFVPLENVRVSTDLEPLGNFSLRLRRKRTGLARAGTSSSGVGPGIGLGAATPGGFVADVAARTAAAREALERSQKDMEALADPGGAAGPPGAGGARRVAPGSSPPVSLSGGAAHAPEPGAASPGGGPEEQGRAAPSGLDEAALPSTAPFGLGHELPDSEEGPLPRRRAAVGQRAGCLTGLFLGCFGRSASAPSPRGSFFRGWGPSLKTRSTLRAEEGGKARLFGGEDDAEDGSLPHPPGLLLNGGGGGGGGAPAETALGDRQPLLSAASKVGGGADGPPTPHASTIPEDPSASTDASPRADAQAADGISVAANGADAGGGVAGGDAAGAAAGADAARPSAVPRAASDSFFARRLLLRKKLSGSSAGSFRSLGSSCMTGSDVMERRLSVESIATASSLLGLNRPKTYGLVLLPMDESVLIKSASVRRGDAIKSRRHHWIALRAPSEAERDAWVRVLTLKGVINMTAMRASGSLTPASRPGSRRRSWTRRLGGPFASSAEATRSSAATSTLSPTNAGAGPGTGPLHFASPLTIEEEGRRQGEGAAEAEAGGEGEGEGEASAALLGVPSGFGGPLPVLREGVVATT